MNPELIFSSVPLLIASAIFIFQLIDAKAEYSARSFIIKYSGSEWWLHNDEKTILPEARSIHLRNVNGSKVSDFGPWPTSSGFGIVSTFLNLLGFKIFGLNAAGFRFFYIIFSFAANVLFILSFFYFLPPFTALLISLLMLLNYRSFLAGRHAYPENILSFILALFIFIYAAYPLFFREHLTALAFFAGAAILIKPNYPLYLYMFTGAVFLSDFSGFSELAGLFVFSFAGLIFFELLHLLILFPAGTVKLRVRNFCCAFKQHRGLSSPGILVRSFPSGIMTAFRHLDFMLDWFDAPPVFVPLFRMLAAILFFVPPFLFFFANSCREALMAFFLCHLFFLAFSSLFFFYLKRAYSWFPLSLLFLTMSANCVLKAEGAPGALILNAILFLALAVSVSRQFSRLRKLSEMRVPSLKNASAELEKLIPDAVPVYAHCFAYRHFWQSEKLRLISCDDQLMDNEKIIDWALRENGEYLLLCSRDAGADAIKYRNLNTETLGIFQSSPVAADYPENYMLLRIIRS